MDSKLSFEVASFALASAASASHAVMARVSTNTVPSNTVSSVSSNAGSPAAKILGQPLALATAAAILSAAAAYFGTGLHPHWWLTWLAPIPVLAASPRLPRWTAFLAAFTAWALGALNMWSYDRVLVRVPVPLIVAIIVVPALIFALAVLLFRRAVRRNALWQAAFGVPSLWVAFEYLVEFRSPHSTFGNLGYSQMDFLPILQISSITGIWAISFCVFLFASSVALLLSPGAGRRKRPVLFTAGGLLIAVFAFGAWRLAFTPSAPTVKVGLVASDLPANLAPRRAAAVPLFTQFAAQIDALSREGAQVVIIPEKNAVLDAASLAAVDRILEDAATRNHIQVFAGVLKIPGTYNEIRGFSPAGALAVTYDKHHMLPQFESDEIPGTTRTTLDQPSGRWGLAICKDMDFPRLSRQYGSDGSGLLLVPAWDFVADGWLHGRMAILRGVESGFSIARSVKQGILTVSDDRGRILAQRTTGDAPFTSLVADVPVRHDATLYARMGDWFAWLNLVALCLLLTAWRRRARHSA